MPTPTTYTYTISTETANGAVAASKLLGEVNTSASVTPSCLEVRTSVESDALYLDMADDLSSYSGEKANLDALVAAHDGNPLSSPAEVNVANQPNVQIRKPSGLEAGRIYGFSVNFCDKTTWFHDAVEVVDEAVGTGDDTTTTFALAHGTNNNADERILDMCHGKMTDENRLANTRGEFRGYGNGYVAPTEGDPNASTAPLSGYVPIVYLDGVEQTERSFGETDGDYQIDYTTGEITFYTPPGAGVAITATYWYAPADGKAYTVVVPGAGKQHMIDRVEIQSSPDACFNCDLLMNVYAGAAWPNGFPVERPTVIKKVSDIVNWAYGSRAQVPIQGGANVRALDHAVNIHQVRYTSTIPLLASQAMYMEVRTALAREFDGTWATVVIYGIEEPEGT